MDVEAFFKELETLSDFEQFDRLREALHKDSPIRETLLFSRQFIKWACNPQLPTKFEQWHVMTDLEMTRLCAEAMGLGFWLERPVWSWEENGAQYFMPLHDDAHAFAVIEKLHLTVEYKDNCWFAYDETNTFEGSSIDSLKRAVVTCAARSGRPLS